MTRSFAIGTVNDQGIVLARGIPGVGNAYKPWLFASFEQSKDGVVLLGRFAMRKGATLFVGMFLGVAVILTMALTFGVLVGDSAVWWGPFFGLGFLAVSVAILKLSHWFARNDAAWMSDFLVRTLS